MCCIVCADYELGKLTKKEAFSNLDEISTSIPPEHLEEAVKLILTTNPDPFDDQDYHNADDMS